MSDNDAILNEIYDMFYDWAFSDELKEDNDKYLFELGDVKYKPRTFGELYDAFVAYINNFEPTKN